jgi:hypothetical protein
MAPRSQARLNRDLDSWIASEHARRRTKQALVLSIVITAVLYVVPFGNLVAYPLMLLSTLVHELGHGISAIFVGGSFERFVMFADGSGVAHTRGVAPGAAQALVAAGGLVGPAVLAGLGFALARRPGGAAMFVGLLGIAFLAVDVLFVRNLFGIVFTGLVGLGLCWAAFGASRAAAQLTLVFLSVQLSLSVFSRGDYLFVDSAQTGAGTMPSDVANMATALGGPYWAWGLACGAFSVLVLLVGSSLFWMALQPRKLAG